MSRAQCCVCQETFDDVDLVDLAGRKFCRPDHAAALERCVPRWSRVGIVEAVATLLFVLGVAGTLGGHRLSTLEGALLALVPSIIWIAHIYRQDRLEPEPLGLVVGVFGLSGLLAYAVTLPAIQALAEALPQSEGGLAPWVLELGVRSPLLVLSAYLTVRYTVYMTSELDEPLDALVYLCAAAAGVAFSSSVSQIVDAQGMLAANGSAIIAATALTCVAGAMPLAVGLARSRFLLGGRLDVVLGFLGSVLLSGLLMEVVLEFGSRGERFRPLESAALATLLSAMVIAAGNVLSVRLRGRFVARAAGPDAALNLVRTGPRPDLPVLIAAALLLAGAGGWLAARGPEAGAVQAMGGRIEAALPAGWVGEDGEGSYEAGPLALDPTGPRLRVVTLQDAASDPDSALLRLEEERRRAGYGYRNLRVEQRAAFGVDDATWSWFAMVVDPVSGGEAKTLPVVVRGVDICLPSAGLGVSLWGRADELAEADIERILSSIRVKP